MSGFESIQVIADADGYLVVNKPAGLLMHETTAHERDTLAHWLLEKYPEIRGVGEAPERPGIVHRLDKEASGLLVVAKTQAMFEHLKAQFQARTMEKEYLVLVHGIMPIEHGMIDFDIDRGSLGRMVSRPKIDPTSLTGVAKKQPGREAITEFFLEKQYTRFALLRVKIHTGRTHQIRVHMLAYNHPVVGDRLYFNKKLNRKRDLELGRLFLHATRLCFDDLEQKKVCCEAPLPEELKNFLEPLK
ncbi:MAG: RNA pseudouridine synthase [Patescibacteria group bacterium]